MKARNTSALLNMMEGDEDNMGGNDGHGTDHTGDSNVNGPSSSMMELDESPSSFAGNEEQPSSNTPTSVLDVAPCQGTTTTSSPPSTAFPQEVETTNNNDRNSDGNANMNSKQTSTASNQPLMVEPIDSIISRLLGLRGSPPGTLCSLAENEIKMLCQRLRPLLLQQPMLLELEAPIKICGDVHGQFTDLLRLFEYGGFPPSSNYLFLGDYVDRGKQSIETICLLLCYKIKYPENFFLLRGNHESAGINRIYGFYDECKRRYSIKLWKIFSDCFNCFPVSAVVDEKILCMHGGLSPELNEGLFQIADLPRPCDVPDVGLMCDLLWSDPDTSIMVR